MRTLVLIAMVGCSSGAKRYTTADATARPGLQIDITEDESAEDLALQPDHAAVVGAPRGEPTGSDGVDNNSPAPDPVDREATMLDKDMIRRVIRSHTDQIRSCYEKQHKATPEIAGTVRVRFTIGPTGNVADATASGIHRNVESCLATTFRQFQFPAPANGTNVQVTYPFAFQAG